MKGSDLTHRLSEAKETLGIDMAKGAFEKARGQIGKDLGKSSLDETKTEEDLLISLSAEGVGKIGGIKNRKQREAALAYANAKTDKEKQAAVAAFKRGAAGAGPRARSELVGGPSGDESEALGRSMEDLRNARDEIASTPEGKAQAVAADAALAMGDVAKRFDSTIDKLILHLNDNMHNS